MMNSGIAVAAAGHTWYMCLPRRDFPARLAAISASWRVFFLHAMDAHSCVRACVCVCVKCIAGAAARGRASGRRRKRLASMASGWKGSSETDGDGDRRCRADGERRRERAHKKCIASGRGSGRVQGVSRAPRRRRFLLININTRPHARQSSQSCDPHSLTRCAFVCECLQCSYETLI